MIIVYLLAKLVQVLLLLLCLAILVVGLHECAMGIWYFARGQVVEGSVVEVEVTKIAKAPVRWGRSRGTGFRFPVISYRFPTAGEELYDIQSFVPRTGLARGDSVRVRVLAHEPTPAGRSGRWWAIS